MHVRSPSSRHYYSRHAIPALHAAAHRHHRHRRRLAVRRRPRALLGARQPRLQRHARDHRLRRVGVRLPRRGAGHRRHDRRRAGARRRRHLGSGATAPIRSATRAPRSSASSPRAKRGPTPGLRIGEPSAGVVIGSGGGGIDVGERQYHDFFVERGRKVTPYAIPVSIVGMVSSEISISLRLRGVSHVLSCGCTSSTDAIGYAAALLRVGRGRRGAVGRRRRVRDAGHDLRLLADARRVDGATTIGRREASRPFDRGRDGFVLGEGAWMVVLEREDRARARGATIYASIDGYGSTCDAYHRVQMAPDGEEIVRAMTLAIERSGRAPRGDRLRQLSRHVDGAERRGRVALRAAGVRRSRRAARRLVGEVDDRPSAGRERRRRRRDGRAGARRAASCRRRSTCTIPIRRAISTSSRTRAARPAVEAALCNCLGLRIEEQRAVIGTGHESHVIDPMHDVLIVGAGPAGAVAGAVLARAGARVRLVDRATFPRDKLCGDTVNPGTLARLRRARSRGEASTSAACASTACVVTGEGGVAIEGRYPGGLSRPRDCRGATSTGCCCSRPIGAGCQFEPGVAVRRRDRRRQARRADRSAASMVGGGGRESPIARARDDRRRRPSFDARLRPRPRAPSRRVRGAGRSARTSRTSYGCVDGRSSDRSARCTCGAGATSASRRCPAG